jgi:hypothetical protein
VGLAGNKNADNETEQAEDRAENLDDQDLDETSAVLAG